MKNTIILAVVGLSFVFCACGNNNENKAAATANEVAEEAGLSADATEKTGSFSIDGKVVTGKIETQYFGDKDKGNFSVLCQHNESNDPANNNFELLQVTFINQNDAITNPSLKIYDGGSILPMTEPEPGIVAVALSGLGSGLGDSPFTGNQKSTGSITVKNRTIELKELSLFTRQGDKKVVNATLPF